MNDKLRARVFPFHALVLMRVERELAAPWIPGISRLADNALKINEHDRCALQIALRIRDTQGGRVSALAWSPATNREGLRYALAAGVERAVFLDGGEMDECDGWTACRILAQTLDKEPFDLILCGTQSQAVLGGLLAPLLAGLLDLPCVTRFVDGEVRDGALYARRSLEGGISETLLCPLPAVVSVLPGEILPRYVSAHRRASVEMHRIEEQSITPPANVWILKELTQPRKRAQMTPTPAVEGSASERMKRMLAGGKPIAATGHVFQGPPQEAAEKLFVYLRDHGLLANRIEG